MLWVIKNWKLVILTISILALLVTGFALYQKGKATAALQYRLQIAEQSAEVWKTQNARLAKSLTAHTERTKTDAAALQTLNNRIKSLHDYADLLGQPDADGVTRDNRCLDDADVDRLRSLWD